ncbi:MAG TPA: histidine phosphatase family protein [bacterium]|nr:histidine phosphatase family protein [bacterium]HPN81572.1 histidine phosphatase family protein [bacterium]
MNHLILVRHGDYSHTGQLNNRGIIQIESLAQKIKMVSNGNRALILTSPADRARQSAEILGRNLSAQLITENILWSDCDHMEDFEGVLELVRAQSDQTETLILVTHYEYVESFPAYFARQELGVDLPCWVIERGEAWVIDCHQKAISRLQPQYEGQTPSPLVFNYQWACFYKIIKKDLFFILLKCVIIY